MRLIMAGSYRAEVSVRRSDHAPFLRASTSTVHVPAIGGWPLPAYIWRPAVHCSWKELFISGIFIEGMAGMTSVTLTLRVGDGLAACIVRVARNDCLGLLSADRRQHGSRIFAAASFRGVRKERVPSAVRLPANSFDPP
jgi:hypothetical protein